MSMFDRPGKDALKRIVRAAVKISRDVKTDEQPSTAGRLSQIMLNAGNNQTGGRRSEGDRGSGSETAYLHRGDVIGVHRIGGVYDHYGVYESDDCVYEYAGGDGDFGGGEIHITTLKKFIGNSGNCFVLEFPEKHGTPGKRSVPLGGLSSGIIQDPRWDVLENFFEQLKSEEYHLYSPDETIRRARSRLGERAYNLALNNCEHFAIWCKTGLHESHQVDAVLRAMIRRPGIVR